MVSPFLLLPALAVLARAATVYFDDRSDSWTLSPLSVFGSISNEEPCQNCTSQPDPDQVFKGTWRDCVSRGTATLRFTGVGVTVYTICPGPHQGGAYSGHFAFSLDGKEQEEFKEAPEGCNIYRYKYPVYTVAGLAKGIHTISITNLVTEGGPESNLLLDYAMVDDGGSSASAKGLPTAAIVVPVLLILLCTIAGMAYLILRKRHMQREERLEEAAPSPYKSPSLRSFHGTIPMTAYMSEHRVPEQALGRVQAVGNDPELEAALRIIASRSRQPASSPPTSPEGPTGFPRDRKGPLRSNPGSQNSTPQSSALGANWSTDVGASSATRADAVAIDGTTPPSYGDVTRRHY